MHSKKFVRIKYHHNKWYHSRSSWISFTTIRARWQNIQTSCWAVFLLSSMAICSLISSPFLFLISSSCSSLLIARANCSCRSSSLVVEGRTDSISVSAAGREEAETQDVTVSHIQEAFHCAAKLNLCHKLLKNYKQVNCMFNCSA